jgi:hypothetical protein
MAAPSAISGMMAGFRGMSGGGGNTQANAHYQAQLNEYLKQKELEKQMALATYQAQLQRENTTYGSHLDAQKEMQKAMLEQQQNEQLRQQMLAAQQAAATAIGMPGQPGVQWQQSPEEASFSPLDTRGMYAQAETAPTGYYSDDPNQRISAVQKLLSGDVVIPGASQNAGIAAVLDMFKSRNEQQASVPASIQEAKAIEEAINRGDLEGAARLRSTADAMTPGELGDIEFAKKRAGAEADSLSAIPEQVKVIDTTLGQFAEMDHKVRSLAHEISPGTVGFGSLIQAIPGMPQRDVANLIASLRGAMSLTSLQALKQASATGASGLGSTSNIEIAMLADQIATLDQGGSEPAMKDNLARVLSTYERLMKSALADREALTKKYEEVSTRRGIEGSIAPYTPPPIAETFNRNRQIIEQQNTPRYTTQSAVGSIPFIGPALAPERPASTGPTLSPDEWWLQQQRGGKP